MIERMSTIDVARASLPCNWIREGHYDALEKTLFQHEQDRSRERIRLQELETVNRQLTQELSQLRIPKAELLLREGDCDCTVKAAVTRCSHCGRKI
jgi:hypothetical protein